MHIDKNTPGIKSHISKIEEQYVFSLDSIGDLMLREVIKETWHSLAEGNTQRKIKRKYEMLNFIDLIKNKAISDITWSYLCEVVANNVRFGRICSILLYILLDKNLYINEWKEKLKELEGVFNIKRYGYYVFEKLFIYDNIKYLYYLPKDNRLRFIYIHADSAILRSALMDFFDKDTANNGKVDLLNYFDESLGIYAPIVNDIEDFSYDVFWEQVNYFRSFEHPKQIIMTLNRFYIYLIHHPSGKGANIFKQGDNLDVNILKRPDFAQRTIDGFKVFYYNPLAPTPFDDKWILHINGFQRASTVYSSTDSLLFNFDEVKSLFFRDLLKKYVWIKLPSNFTYKRSQFRLLVGLLNYIYDIKHQKNYPNPKIDYINNQEAYIIKKNIGGLELSLASKNSKLTAIRQFFKAQETENIMTFDIMVFDYLKQFKYTKPNNAHAIPDDDLIKIDAVMKRNESKSYFGTLCYAIFHVCLQTEFRISQVCHLEAGCTVNTLKNKQFEIRTNSKTSHGQQYTAIISNLTKAHLDDIIKKSKPVREACSDVLVKDYLFLYKSRLNQYKPVSANIFNSYFTKCCIEANVPIYNAANLRDTHMTKAHEYILRHNKSDREITVLSQHKRIDTDNNHYIETQLIKMLEATYGIIIGDVNIKGEIVEEIKYNNIANHEHIVEGGCGFCKKEICLVYNLTSCLLCKYFITTIHHERQFIDFITQIDNMIDSASYRHDKDDLINIKRLAGAYLLEILRKKENLSNECRG